MKIIFAQGNPGHTYEKTRHNTGFLVVDALADTHSAKWKEETKWNAQIAELSLQGEKVLLVKPLSFYNETGVVARRLIDFYKAEPADDFLVIHDDLALPLGTIRIRQKGSDAGNNGIKSLNTHLGDRYTRIRVGIWTEDRNRMDDTNFVLAKFSRAEHQRLEKEIIPHVIKQVDAFIVGQLEATSDTL